MMHWCLKALSPRMSLGCACKGSGPAIVTFDGDEREATRSSELVDLKRIKVGCRRQNARKGIDMRRTLMIVFTTALIGGAALAQNVVPHPDSTNNPAANSAASNSDRKAPTQPQPQGHPGTTNTTSGGAPASSPQGDTPSGMQPIPNDPKQAVEPKK
jgi:hypothetical protein